MIKDIQWKRIKNNKASKNFNIDDRQISEDFSEIFDKSENVEDLSTLFIARVKRLNSRRC